MLGLLLVVCAADVATIRAALTRGEKALQAGAWKEASEYYEQSLTLMRANSLWVNVGAESQLYNNVGWAALQLGDYDRALSHFENGARACDRAMTQECADKLYENLHELLLRMNRRQDAIAWMRRGLESVPPSLGETIRLRLGYLLVVDSQLDEAERVLGPLMRSSLRQEAATYLAWARTFRRDWKTASEIASYGASIGAAGCHVQEGWLQQTSWRVLPLATAVPEGTLRAVLVEIYDAHLSGQEGTALWQPGCRVFTGTATASSSLPTDWGAFSFAKKDTIDRDVVVLLFDSRGAHKLFWHYQTETVSKLCVVISRLFDVNGEPAADLPEDVRSNLARATLVLPSTIGRLITALIQKGHSTLTKLDAAGRLGAYDWRPGAVFRFGVAYLVDWARPWGEPRWELDASGRRRHLDSLYRLHYVPPAALRLQAAVLRHTFPSSSSGHILLYSRTTTENRVIVAEDELRLALETKVGRPVVVWRDDPGENPSRTALHWSGASLVVGPNGDGLANMVYCRAGTPIIVLAVKDAKGAPSAGDDIYRHTAMALGLPFSFHVVPSPPSYFDNFTDDVTIEMDNTATSTGA